MRLLKSVDNILKLQKILSREILVDFSFGKAVGWIHSKIGFLRAGRTTASNCTRIINLVENFPIAFLPAIRIFADDDSLKICLAGFTELRKCVFF